MMNENESKSEIGNGGWWKSLEQYEGNTEFVKRAQNEFMSSPYAPRDAKDGIARRDFLKLMGASLAMATTACIRRPVQKIIPYAQAPKDVTPGIANFYTSTWFDGVEGAGVLVKTLEGRPLKLEGNPLHPMNLGGLTARAHAEVLSCYDPDRLQAPIRNLPNKTRTNKETVSAKWEDVDTAVLEQLAKGGVAILSSTLPSRSTRAMIGDFTKAFPGTRWIQYDALPADAVVEAQRRSYGKAVMPRYRFDEARMIVSVDADFLGTYLSPAEFMKGYAKARKPGANMARFVAFDSHMSLTSMNADDRFRIKPSQHLDVVLGLINQVVKASKGGASVPGGVSGYLSQYDNAAETLGIKPELFAQVATELWAHRGQGLVIAGGLPTEHSVDVQVAVNILNSILGNDGKTIDHDGAPLETRQGSTKDLVSLIADMEAGKVKTLIVHNLNPAYVLPADSGYAEAIKKVDLIISTSNMNDETGKSANYVLPNGSSLESWGDFELQSGVLSIQQPTIRPMYDTRSFEESLLAWTQKSKSVPARAKDAADYHAYVQSIWKTDVFPHASEGKGKSFDDFWLTVLANGVVEIGGKRDNAGTGRAYGSGGALAKPTKASASGYELVLYPSVQLADGRYANIPWLQELPDPTTKIVWDSYVMMSMAAARKEKINEGDKIEVTVGKQQLVLPVHIQPGLHDDVLAVAVGYGRTDGGKVAKDIGVNAYTLASFAGGAPVFAGLATSIKKTGETYDLVSTQHHHSMEGREIIIEATNERYTKNNASGIENHEIFSIWPQHQYTRHKWAMAVDLNACTGCSACVIACQSENNVPVVGKRYVMEGREMHWIRIDRYYNGNPEAPDSVFMPLMCQQCETAPCETVCPVLATVHNDEGLNDMVYNRCVGTRYCSNNCPYKVRRFNWFNYSKREAPTHMALNPDVTVRPRGVMEKCTFCVHRIRAVTTGIGSTKKPGSIKDGTIKTACQETCPTNAIVFGDLADPDSQVRKLFEAKRTYSLLEDLNTQPRVRYQTRIRNGERASVEKEEAAPDKSLEKKADEKAPAKESSTQMAWTMEGSV